MRGPLGTRADEYSKEVESFMKNTRVKYLQRTLKRFRQLAKTHNILVSITLENAWGDQSMWLVKVLVQTLFPSKNPDEYQWFEIVPGTVVATFSAIQDLMTSLTEESTKKLHFMRLIGAIGLQVGSNCIMEESENEHFTFEESLIQATLENNIEAVQFLLEHVHVNINVQTDHPIMRTGATYFTEQNVIHESSSLHKTFASLMKDFESEMWIQDEASLTSAAERIPSLQTTMYKSTDDFIEGLKSFQSFLNHHQMDKLVQQLSDTLPDDEKSHLKQLASEIHKYGDRIELFKKQVQLSYIHQPLQKYFQTQPKGIIQVTLVLEMVWRECSLQFVEQLLQSIFYPKHVSMFQWFRVNTTMKSVSVVFLAPNQTKGSLLEKVNELEINFLALMGIISLKIGDESRIIKSTYTMDTYSFKEAAKQAKTTGNNAVVNLLQYIQQEKVNTREISQMNENGKFIPNINSMSTPLIIACCDDNTKMVKLLLQNKADPNIQNDRGFTALMYVSMYGNVRTFRALLDHGADIKKSCLLGSNVLFAACRTGNVEIIKLLLEEKSDVVRVLLEEPGSVNIQRNDGMTPLIYLSCHYRSQKTLPNMTSCYHNWRQIAELLLKAGADVNIQDAYGLTALNRASYNGCIKMVEQLLQAQADPNIRDIDGKTALYLASDQGQLEIVEILLEANADPKIKTEEGSTPLVIAIHKGHTQVAHRLQLALE